MIEQHARELQQRLDFTEACAEVMDFDALLSGTSGLLFKWSQADFVALVLPSADESQPPNIHVSGRQPLLPLAERSVRHQVAATLAEAVYADVLPEEIPIHRGAELTPLHTPLRDDPLYPVFSSRLEAEGEIVGVLILFSFTDWILSQRTRHLLRGLAPTFARAIRVAGMIQNLRAHADRDPLTGALNRRGMEAALRREVSRAQRSRRPLSLLLLDLDYFKQVNDTYGHACGDALLSALCESFTAQLRPSDVLVRLGGDEFAILLPDVAQDVAGQIGERLVRQARQTQVGPVPSISLSVGVAELALDHHDPIPALFERADEALYAAKEAGRGRISLAV
ncbi:GGDEF domain-containing protein [Myxococcota bacterium]|nr:GGDEF domain-containing protein [Myxococcota bacterium]MBU1432080.1 GGDEF domain-containing protein [Myxococcota bacterium]MBU1897778.1 GGDEF domain-containing protein [Myxococcota bacterium]